MAYSTIEDLKRILPEQALIELTDDAGTGSISEDVANEAIAQADREIDAYCGTRYPVPLDPVPDLIRDISAQIAIYHLYARRSIESEVWAQKYKNAQKLLDLIRTGKLSLGPTESQKRAPERRVIFSGYQKIFNRSFFEEF